MENMKAKEYLFLREEIQTNFKDQQTWSTFSIGAVLTFLGIALKIDDKPELCLLPLIMLLLASIKMRNYRTSTTKIVGYLIERCESSETFLWETALYNLRYKVKKENSKKTGIRGCYSKVVSFLETQELTLMGITCVAVYNVLSLKHEGINLYQIGSLNFIAILTLAFTMVISKDYWNLDPDLISQQRNIWRDCIKSAVSEQTKGCK